MTLATTFGGILNKPESDAFNPTASGEPNKPTQLANTDMQNLVDGRLDMVKGQLEAQLQNWNAEADSESHR